MTVVVCFLYTFLELELKNLCWAVVHDNINIWKTKAQDRDQDQIIRTESYWDRDWDRFSEPEMTGTGTGPGSLPVCHSYRQMNRHDDVHYRPAAASIVESPPPTGCLQIPRDFPRLVSFDYPRDTNFEGRQMKELGQMLSQSTLSGKLKLLSNFLCWRHARKIFYMIFN